MFASQKRAVTAYSTLVFLVTFLIMVILIGTFIVAVNAVVRNAALTVGRDALKDYTSYIKPELVYATDGTQQTLDYFYIKAKLLPASGDVPLTTTLIEMDLFNISADLQYGTGPCTEDTSYNENGTAGFWTNMTTELGYYTIQYMHNGTKHRDGMLVDGDVVKFCLRAPRGITEGDTIKFGVIPSKGNPWIYEHEVSPYTEPIVQIFP